MYVHPERWEPRPEQSSFINPDNLRWWMMWLMMLTAACVANAIICIGIPGFTGASVAVNLLFAALSAGVTHFVGNWIGALEEENR